jgi:hypothetical protein
MERTFSKQVRFLSDDGFEFHSEPIEDTLTLKETKDGFEAKYLVQDECYDTDDRADEGLFHVNYHRDYWVENKKIITEDDLKEWYQTGKCSQQKEYHIFPLKSLIHSGVWLSLGTGGFECDTGGWDTSHVGAVLVSKKEWKTKAKAEKAAESFVDEANKLNSGDVYCCVREMFNKDKEPVDYDVCGGFIGFDYAKKSLKDF